MPKVIWTFPESCILSKATVCHLFDCVY